MFNLDSQVHLILYIFLHIFLSLTFPLESQVHLALYIFLLIILSFFSYSFPPHLPPSILPSSSHTITSPQTLPTSSPFPQAVSHSHLLSLSPPELPHGAPRLEGGQEEYRVGQGVNLTCTMPSSVPLATLTWFINGQEVRSGQVRSRGVDLS